MSLRSAILAAATLCAYVADAHIIMASPVPFSADKIDNAPISKSQYPCKSNLGFTVTTMNSMAVGEEQTLSFKGSAVHGGGSCQLAVTTDTEPTANSKFKVIKSIEGGCPGVESALTFPFTLPDSIPNGKATFAWTWFSKLSGGPELYMNCAPIEVTGGASDDSKFQELPDMLIANIDDTCKSVPNFAVKFPAPGAAVADGGLNDLKDPVGPGCGAPTPADPSSPAGSGTPASSAAAGPSAAPSAAPSSGGNDGMYTPPAGAATSAAAVPTSAAAVPTSAAAVPTSAAAVPTSAAASEAPVTSAAASSGAGGVYAPGASSAAAGASTQTTLVTVTGTPAAPVKSTPAASAPAAATSAAGTGTSPAQPSSAPAAGGNGTCTTEGAIVCNGPTQFGLCNQGKIVWQPVAAGTTCTDGNIQKRGYNGRIVRRHRGLIGHVHKY